MLHKTLLKSAGIAALLSLGTGMAAQAQTIITTSNGIIRNSLCVGNDCQAGIVFGDSTIVLKENNTRLKFADTSSTSSFPSTDWELEANSQTNGGANRFSIVDCGTASNDGGCSEPDNVFSVEANAGSNALYVDDGGRVGFGTSLPVVELHTVDGDTPTLRLEQTNANGFTPQTFDVAGNETNFFIRDVTNGSTLPFRIRPGAPSSSIDIAADGDVGIGTSSPDAVLHVNAGGADYTAGGGADDMIVQDDGPARLVLVNTATVGNPNWIFNSNDTLRISAGTDGAEFTLDDSGNLTILGTLTENSNRNAKMAIAPVDAREILDKVAALEVSAWTYKHDAEDGIRHIGPMAQDFHAAFGLGAGPTGISTMDTSGVALAAIRALVEENRALTARIDALENDLR